MSWQFHFYDCICVRQPGTRPPMIPASLYSCPYMIPSTATPPPHPPECGTNRLTSHKEKMAEVIRWQFWDWVIKRPWLPSWEFPCVCQSLCLCLCLWLPAAMFWGQSGNLQRGLWGTEVYQSPHEWASASPEASQYSCQWARMWLPPSLAFRWDRSPGWQPNFNLSSTSETLSQKRWLRCTTMKE